MTRRSVFGRSSTRQPVRGHRRLGHRLLDAATIDDIKEARVPDDVLQWRAGLHSVPERRAVSGRSSTRFSFRSSHLSSAPPRQDSLDIATHDLIRGMARVRDDAPAVVRRAEDVGHATDGHDTAVRARTGVRAADNRGTRAEDADILGRKNGSVPAPLDQSCDRRLEPRQILFLGRRDPDFRFPPRVIHGRVKISVDSASGFLS